MSGLFLEEAVPPAIIKDQTYADDSAVYIPAPDFSALYFKIRHVLQILLDVVDEFSLRLTCGPCKSAVLVSMARGCRWSVFLRMLIVAALVLDSRFVTDSFLLFLFISTFVPGLPTRGVVVDARFKNSMLKETPGQLCLVFHPRTILQDIRVSLAKSLL